MGAGQKSKHEVIDLSQFVQRPVTRCRIMKEFCKFAYEEICLIDKDYITNLGEGKIEAKGRPDLSTECPLEYEEEEEA